MKMYFNFCVAFLSLILSVFLNNLEKCTGIPHPHPNSNSYMHNQFMIDKPNCLSTIKVKCSGRKVVVWTFNPIKGRCARIHAEDCGGNVYPGNNRFGSLEKCTKACDKVRKSKIKPSKSAKRTFKIRNRIITL